ncbi:hypothetical protein ABT256_20275 [Amycolatopsis japonica]|uniref:hypothetical protein n=1 Tax=Amycolatopsis japonica TaxID=208439 RepID=UPI003327949C
MSIRTTLRAGVLATVAVMTTALGMVSAEAVPGWQATLLPLPVGHPGATGFVFGTDGKGGYAGELAIDDHIQLVTWRDGKVSVRGVPSGYQDAHVIDQNSAGTVLLEANGAVGSRTFVLDERGFHEVPVPAGYTGTWAVALNDRGDILGTASTGKPDDHVTVVWPALGVGPIVIPTDKDARPADLDTDGTVLFNSSGRPYTWRNGTVENLAIPAGYTVASVRSIKNGTVVGSADAEGVNGSTGFRWASATSPERLTDSSVGSLINGSGLISGALTSEPGVSYGHPAVWQGPGSVAKLPLPDGFGVGAAYAIGDDGAIAGIAANGPLDEGGAPVVWHRTEIGHG